MDKYIELFNRKIQTEQNEKYDLNILLQTMNLINMKFKVLIESGSNTIFEAYDISVSSSYNYSKEFNTGPYDDYSVKVLVPLSVRGQITDYKLCTIKK